MSLNIPDTGQPRVVIVGSGFGGLMLARKLRRSAFQVVLLDRNNYHQFQPLFYQVATAGLEPSAISFPMRKLFHRVDNVSIRIAEVTQVDTERQVVVTSVGELGYDYLVLAMGADTNFFGNQNIIRHALPMKSVGEALLVRNTILETFERLVTEEDVVERERLMNIVIVGGGATGVEVAGALAEMRRHVLPKDYPDVDFSALRIHIVEAGANLLESMSPFAQRKAAAYLKRLGVIIHLNTRVQDYDGKEVAFANGTVQPAHNVIWAAGIKGSSIAGVDPALLGRGGRIKVDVGLKVGEWTNVFALGDVALQSGDTLFPNGHPQVAQVAIQQGKWLAKYLKNKLRGKATLPFKYKDLGSMATVGRNLAVVDLPRFRFGGFFAWAVWMFIHLFAILGAKNKLFIFINWAWNYITYDQSLRLIIRPSNKRAKPE